MCWAGPSLSTIRVPAAEQALWDADAAVVVKHFLTWSNGNGHLIQKPPPKDALAARLQANEREYPAFNPVLSHETVIDRTTRSTRRG
jgi:hypothetical protein